jgi:hypothetical protein
LPRPRFSRLNHTGAEEYRQAAIARTRQTDLLPGINVSISFNLLKQKKVDGIPKTMSCQPLRMFKFQSYQSYNLINLISNLIRKRFCTPYSSNSFLIQRLYPYLTHS